MVLAFIAAASAFTASTGTAEQMARVEERLRNFMQTNGIAEKTALCMGLAPDGTIAGAITELMKNNVDGGGPAAELEADFQAAQTARAVLPRGGAFESERLSEGRLCVAGYGLCIRRRRHAEARRLLRGRAQG